MANNTSVEKSQAFIDEYKLGELITFSEAGVPTVTADMFKTIVLDDADIAITEQQHNRMHRKSGELFAAVALLGSQESAKIFQANPDHREVAISYPIGKTGNASVVYTRGEDNKVTILGNIATRHDTAEFNRVLKHADTLFADINS